MCLLHLEADAELIAAKALKVDTRHVLRAYECLRLCHKTLSWWMSGNAEALTVAKEPALRDSLNCAERLATALEQKLPHSQFQAFEPTQGAATEPVLDAAGEEASLLRDVDAPSFDEGFGEQGETVQDPADGQIILRDRAACLQYEL